MLIPWPLRAMPESILRVGDVSGAAVELHDLIAKHGVGQRRMDRILAEELVLSVRDGDQVRLVERAVLARFFVQRVAQILVGRDDAASHLSHTDCFSRRFRVAAA